MEQRAVLDIIFLYTDFRFRRLLLDTSTSSHLENNTGSYSLVFQYHLFCSQSASSLTVYCLLVLQHARRARSIWYVNHVHRRRQSLLNTWLPSASVACRTQIPIADRQYWWYHQHAWSERPMVGNHEHWLWPPRWNFRTQALSRSHACLLSMETSPNSLEPSSPLSLGKEGPLDLEHS